MLRLALAGTVVLGVVLFTVTFVQRDPSVTSSENVVATATTAPSDSSTTTFVDAANIAATEVTTTPAAPLVVGPSQGTFVDLNGVARPASKITIESPYSLTIELETDITGAWSAHVVFVGAPVGAKFSGTVTNEGGPMPFEVTL